MKKFHFEIMTPERQFFEEDVHAVTVQCVDGQLTVLAGHQPMVAALVVGEVRILSDEGWKEAFNSEGFLEVRPDRVLMFSQACEWPEEIDVNRAKEALERAQARLKEKETIYEYRHTQISIARAMMRLRLGRNNKYNK